MTTGINPPSIKTSKDNYVENPVKDFFATHRTALKIASNFSILVSVLVFAKQYTSYDLLPSGKFFDKNFNVNTPGVLGVIGLATCYAFSFIAEDFEKSLSVSDANRKYSQVDLKNLDQARA